MSLFKNQRGFTLIELAVVIVIVVLLAAFFAMNLWRSREDAKVGVANTWLINTLPTAIAAHVSRTGDSDGLTEKDLIERGTKAKTEWDETWTASGAGGKVMVKYQILYPATAAKIREDIAKTLQKLVTTTSVIESAADDGSNVAVVYRAR